MDLVGQLAGRYDFNNVLSAIIMATDFLLNAHKPTIRRSAKYHADQTECQPRRAGSASAGIFRKQTLRPRVLDLGEVLSDLTMLLRG